MSFWLVFGAIWHIVGLVVSFFVGIIGFVASLEEGDGVLFVISMTAVVAFTVLFSGLLVGWGVF